MKTIIFDFDGVIIDSFNVVFNILYQNIKRYTKLDVEIHELKKEYRNNSLKEIINRYKINKLLLPVIYWKISHNYSKFIDEMKPFKGVEETFYYLKKKRYNIGILSSNKKKI